MFPRHPWESQQVDGSPPPEPRYDPGCQALLTSLRRLRRRHAGRLLTGYTLLAAVASVAPDVLHRRLIGQLSVALILLIAQLALIALVLTGHRNGARRIDADTERYGQSLAAYGRRAAP